jgi:hypothetical protein
MKQLDFPFGIALASSANEEMAPMSRTFMSPLRTFTLESLVALERWSAEQANSRRKSGADRAKHSNTKTEPARPAKAARTEL